MRHVAASDTYLLTQELDFSSAARRQCSLHGQFGAGARSNMLARFRQLINNKGEVRIVELGLAVQWQATCDAVDSHHLRGEHASKADRRFSRAPVPGQIDTLRNRHPGDLDTTTEHGCH